MSVIKKVLVIAGFYFIFFLFFHNLVFSSDSKVLLFIVSLLVLILVVVFLWVWSLKKQISLRTKQLYQSWENIKITLNSIGDAVIATDINGNVTRMNPAAENLTGWMIENAEGKPLNEVFHIVNAKTLKKVDNPVEKVLKTGNIIGLANHTMLISKNGQKYHIADSAAPIKTGDGTIQGVVLVFRDVSKSYILQEKLRKSEEIFSAFMEYFPGEAFIKDENLKFVFINNYMKQHRDADIWIGKDLFELPVPPELAKYITEQDKKALEYGSYETEEQKPDASGIYHDYLTHRFAILLPNGQKFVGGISINISEYKEIEEKLKQSEEKYRKLIETTSEGFVFTNYKNQITYVNQSICSMVGYSRDELMGKTPFDFVDDENRKIFEEQIAKVKTSLHRTYEIVLRKKNGEMFPTLFNATTLMSEDEEKISSFAFITDLTKQKESEKELQKMERLNSIGTLAGGIAHDFNNIMTGLFGNISIAKSEISSDHPSFTAIVKAENSIHRARLLTQQLLTFAKGGAPVQENISIYNLAKEIIIFDLSGSNVKPVLKKKDGLWMAKADKAQMQQVFSNLAINAVQAMPHGGHLYMDFENVTIAEYSEQALKPGAYIKITIKDEGQGIDEKDLPHIFDPYFTTKKTGSGLGLATVYSIITRHNGLIEVDTEPGIGTNFVLYLPAETENKLDGNGIMERKDMDDICGNSFVRCNSARILVMDDEEMICEVTSDMLERMGYQVETVCDGKAAIEIYALSIKEKRPFDVIIMDLTIPGGIGGKEAVQEILAVNSDAVVLVSSGYADDPVMADYEKYGFKGIIAKPYTMSNLSEILQKIFKSGKATQQYKSS